MLALLTLLSSPAHACFGCHYDTLITLVAVGQDSSLVVVVSMGSADAATRYLPGGVRTQHDLNADDPTAEHTEDRAAEPRLNYAVRKTERPELPEAWRSTYTVLERDQAGTWAGGGWTITTTRATMPRDDEMGTTIEERLVAFEGPCSILAGHPQTVETDGVCSLALSP